MKDESLSVKSEMLRKRKWYKIN